MELQGVVEAVVGDVGQVGPAGGVAGHVGREGSWVEEGTVGVYRLHPPDVHPLQGGQEQLPLPWTL